MKMGGKKEFENNLTIITESQNAASNIQKMKKIKEKIEKMNGVRVEEISSEPKK